MELAVLDVVIFVVFMITVVAVGLLKSRNETSSEDYFLAGRGLNWLLIGISLIAANISAEQFIGMSGQAARDSIGLAVASYEWIAAVTLVAVAFFFLPTFLRSGIYTIPEFLEYRFNHTARTLMSLSMLIIYVGVTIATVIFLGAKALDPLFTGTFLGIPMNITSLSWIVGILAALYVAAGGLKACAWADLIQGSALVLGGAVILVLALQALDNPDAFEGTSLAATSQALNLEESATFSERFAVLKETKMHMVLPETSTFLPWTALLLGIWIPNFYYWGLNQYIMQRTLGASSLAEGQKGVILAAFLKLIIPFIVCVPGIIAFALYGDLLHENAMINPQLNKTVLEAYEESKAAPKESGRLFAFDEDFANLEPELSAELLAFNAQVAGQPVPAGENLFELNDELISQANENESAKAGDVQQQLVGYDYDHAFPLLIRYLTPVGLRGFVLAALMGAVISSLASMLNASSTIFTMDIYREWFNKEASQESLVRVGRMCVPICVIIGCLIAPQLANPKFGGAFAYIQEFQGFISPGILAVFLFGLFVKRSPRMCGTLGLVISPVAYGFLYVTYGDMAFLNRMAISVGVVMAVLAFVTLIKPLPEPVTLPEQTKIEMKESKGAKALGLVVVVLTAALYLLFW